LFNNEGKVKKMATRDFARSAEKSNFTIDLYYNPDTKTVSHAHNSATPKSVIFQGTNEGSLRPITSSYQVDPSAKKINTQRYVLPADELVPMVTAITSYDPKGYSYKLAITETDMVGREYYVSLAKPHGAQILLTVDNVAEAVRLMKDKESIKKLGVSDESGIADIRPPDQADGPK
jgi:hypothetical protein